MRKPLILGFAAGVVATVVVAGIGLRARPAVGLRALGGEPLITKALQELIEDDKHQPYVAPDQKARFAGSFDTDLFEVQVTEKRR